MEEHLEALMTKASSLPLDKRLTKTLKMAKHVFTIYCFWLSGFLERHLPRMALHMEDFKM